MRTKRNLSIEKMVLLALFTALVAIFSYLGGFIKIGGLASISLTLIPIVLGAALCGPVSGAWLGGVSGAIFFVTPDAAFWFGLSIPGTIITVMLKGIAAGLLAGFTYKFFERFNRYLAVIISAIVCPVINTGIFIIGCFIFFMDTVNGFALEAGMSVGAYIIVGFVGLNFVFELLSNIIFSPAIVRLLDIKKKPQAAKGRSNKTNSQESNDSIENKIQKK